MRDILRRLLGWKSATVAPVIPPTQIFVGSVCGPGRFGRVASPGKTGSVRTAGDIEPLED